MEKIINTHWFNLVSWAITAVIVVCILGFAYLHIQNRSETIPPKMEMVSDRPKATPMGAPTSISWFQLPAITRKLTLKTIIPQRPLYEPTTYTVQRGDSINAIAKEFNIKPDTLLFANYDVLEDDPHGLRPGQELNIPPTDGILHKWKDGDALDKIASEYKANPDDILGWFGNKIDLTAPTIQTGQLVMIPGGSRESRAQVIQTASGSTASGCAGGAATRGFFAWPVGSQSLSGNDYSGGHGGLDLVANEGDSVLAADSGVVSMSQDGWNSGYGNVIQIDHGNGFVTVYAHLSGRNVSKCENVFGGQLIGAAGNTGNSSGAHLHFEIRSGSSRVNPWDYLP